MRMIRLQNKEDFQQHQAGMQTLIHQYQAILADDFTQPDQLIHHVASNMPYVWIALGNQNQVQLIASLSDVIPGQSAFLHGISAPYLGRKNAIDALTESVLGCAFQELKLHKLKAEFEANNMGALGFCRRMGFSKEAHFKAETRLQGTWHDACRYVLFADTYFSRKGDSHVIRS